MQISLNYKINYTTGQKNNAVFNYLISKSKTLIKLPSTNSIRKISWRKAGSKKHFNLKTSKGKVKLSNRLFYRGYMSLRDQYNFTIKWRHK